MPSNTLFSKYEPQVFGPLEIKGETWEHDFLVTNDLASAIEYENSDELCEKLERAEKTGESLAMDFESMGRDGCFEPKQLFAVWGEADILALIDRLKLCLPPSE